MELSEALRNGHGKTPQEGSASQPQQANLVPNLLFQFLPRSLQISITTNTKLSGAFLGPHPPSYAEMVNKSQPSAFPTVGMSELRPPMPIHHPSNFYPDGTNWGLR
ncbi:hypothetical protein GOP47_0025038 [Adiantum capillus-veneris]|uniref:Uncharacterized protein n=1 Tax=Adiantum capillus-veneris TaxID=13818 RepID=A0A9D4U431_ADICA|nr:hypothetical protein GOP47_0025038 [Adiantum capillus-veneris]